MHAAKTMFTAKFPLMFLQGIHFAAVILFRYEASLHYMFGKRRISIGCVVNL